MLPRVTSNCKGLLITGLAKKEIARIERNEIGKPHAKTVDAITARLGVRPEEIESY